MTKLEKKLIELGYEFFCETTYIDSQLKVKQYAKEVGKNQFNQIWIIKDRIEKVCVANKEEMEKDLAILNSIK